MAMEIDGNCTDLVVHGTGQEIELASPGGGKMCTLRTFSASSSTFAAALQLCFPRKPSSRTGNMSIKSTSWLFFKCMLKRRALQESTEQRVHAALVETRNEIVMSTRDLVSATAQDIRNGVELGVNAALHEKLGVSFAPVEAAANERMQALSAVLSEKLTTTMKASFEEAKEAALGELQAKTVALLSRAEEQLESRVTGILVDPVSAGDDQPSRVLTAVMGFMEAAIERQVERMNRSQSDALVVQTAAQVMMRFQDKIESALAEVRMTATSSAEATALDVERRSTEGEQRLMQYFQDAIELFQKKRTEETANVEALQQHVSAIAQLVVEFQHRIEKKLKSSQRRVDASVIDALDQRSASLELSLGNIVDMKLAGRETAQPVSSAEVASSVSIVEAVTLAIEKLGQSLERGFDSTRQSLKDEREQSVVRSSAPQASSSPAVSAPPSTAAEVRLPSALVAAIQKLPSAQQQGAGGHAPDIKEAKPSAKGVEDLLNEALSTACARAVTDNDIQKRLDALQASKRKKAAADAALKVSQLPTKMQERLRRLERDFDDE